MILGGPHISMARLGDQPVDRAVVREIIGTKSVTQASRCPARAGSAVTGMVTDLALTSAQGASSMDRAVPVLEIAARIVKRPCSKSRSVQSTRTASSGRTPQKVSIRRSGSNPGSWSSAAASSRRTLPTGKTSILVRLISTKSLRRIGISFSYPRSCP